MRIKHFSGLVLLGISAVAITGCASNPGTTGSMHDPAAQVNRFQFHTLHDQVYVMDSATGQVWVASDSKLTSDPAAFVKPKLLP